MTLHEQIEKILDRVRPGLRLDGGDIELVEADEATGIVKVKLHGACRNCPMSQMTLKWGVEAALSEQLPWVKEVMNLEEATE
jgi:Fe-S cluster biogenesis protein NfuA